MTSGNQDEAWPMYHVWPICERFMLGWFGGTWPACCYWLNTGTVGGRWPIMFLLTRSCQCDTWFFCSTLRELALSNLSQLLFCRSITWSRCRNAYRYLWIMTIGISVSFDFMGEPRKAEHSDRIQISSHINKADQRNEIKAVLSTWQCDIMSVRQSQCDACLCPRNSSTLVQIVSCCLYGVKPLIYVNDDLYLIRPTKHMPMKRHIQKIVFGRMHSKWSSAKYLLICSGLRQEDITWANTDPDFCRNMASLGQTEL